MNRNIFALSIVLFVSLFGRADLAEENGSLTAKTPSGPALWIESNTIELGMIPSEQDTIVGMIPIINDGDEPLEILKVSGPCACFEGWAGDKVVLPGEGGMITVKFDKSKCCRPWYSGCGWLCECYICQM